MSRLNCSRKWQVEAARDGRLRGKDLESARRHQATCAECSAEEREFAALETQLAALPELARDPLTAQRTRHSLLAAMNDSLLARREQRRLRRAALAFVLAPGLCFAALGATWLAVRRAPGSPTLAASAPSFSSPAPVFSVAIDPAPIAAPSTPAPEIRPSVPRAIAGSARPLVDESSSKAEDDAYLYIVELLRQGKDNEARARAKSYLLRFPNGFRRVEVLNIATRAP